MVKKDPHKHKEKFNRWKESVRDGIPGISKSNSDIIKKFINDMEFGRNVSVSSKKGGRSYIRLNTLRDKMMFFARKTEEIFNLDCVTKISEDQIIQFFGEMRSGLIKTATGGEYKSVGYFVKNFKAFWHWHMLTMKRERKEIPDITTYLDSKVDKSKWVYLTEEDVRKLSNKAKYDIKVLIWFLYDTGIRAPTELSNIKVNDLSDDYNTLSIRDEISKTVGRKIKLMLCSNLLKEYIQDKELTESDYLFNFSPAYVNRYLKKLAKKVLGDVKSPAGKKYSELTMYHFRHSSACYWLRNYKTEAGFKYRFGWIKSDMIHYYTELLGMRDDIQEEDLMSDVNKTELQQKIVQMERELKIVREELETMKNYWNAANTESLQIRNKVDKLFNMYQ